jgi:hypothetical protein
MEATSEGKVENPKTPRVPKAVFFILVNILLERFCTTGTSGSCDF